MVTDFCFLLLGCTEGGVQVAQFVGVLQRVRDLSLQAQQSLHACMSTFHEPLYTPVTPLFIPHRGVTGGRGLKVQLQEHSMSIGRAVAEAVA